MDKNKNLNHNIDILTTENVKLKEEIKIKK